MRSSQVQAQLQTLERFHLWRYIRWLCIDEAGVLQKLPSHNFTALKLVRVGPAWQGETLAILDTFRCSPLQGLTGVPEPTLAEPIQPDLSLVALSSLTRLELTCQHSQTRLNALSALSSLKAVEFHFAPVFSQLQLPYLEELVIRPQKVRKSDDLKHFLERTPLLTRLDFASSSGSLPSLINNTLLLRAKFSSCSDERWLSGFPSLTALTLHTAIAPLTSLRDLVSLKAQNTYGRIICPLTNLRTLLLRRSPSQTLELPLLEELECWGIVLRASQFTRLRKLSLLLDVARPAEEQCRPLPRFTSLTHLSIYSSVERSLAEMALVFQCVSQLSLRYFKTTLYPSLPGRVDAATLGYLTQCTSLEILDFHFLIDGDLIVPLLKLPLLVQVSPCANNWTHLRYEHTMTPSSRKRKLESDP